MNADDPNLMLDDRTHSTLGPADDQVRRGSRVWPWVNWGLAITTAVAAAFTMLFAIGAVMSTAACADKPCPNLGHGGIGFGVAFYGAPVVALAVIVLSFFTAKRTAGIVVPLCGLALLVADVVVIAATVAQ